MKKRCFFAILLFVNLVGCGKNSNDSQFNPHSKPLPELNTLQLIGLNNKCQTNLGFLMINSFEIVSINNDELSDYDKGVYIVLKIETDLSSDQLAIPHKNADTGNIELWMSNDEAYNLDYYSYDVLNNEIYCKFDETKKLLKESVLDLNVSNEKSITFPFFMISFSCFQYCIINDIQYYNVNFYLPLK